MSPLLLLLLALGGNDPNACDAPGEAPDVIVGDIDAIMRHGTLNGISAYSFGTWSCNVGTCWLDWEPENSAHPVIGQNLFRLLDGRFEQIGQSWLKHGFFATSEQLCSQSTCLTTDGTHLGVNCADPYSASLNGLQGGLGPKSEVDAATGSFPYPFRGFGQTGDAIYKRLQVHDTDLDAGLNPGALYFVEGQYITADDAAAGNDANNASFREVRFIQTFGSFVPTLVGETQRELAAIHAWKQHDTGVVETSADVPGDGRFILAARVTTEGTGSWHYEYALYNASSHRSAHWFRVPVPLGAVVSNPGFHDVDYHSGEPYAPTDWEPLVEASAVSWSTTPFAVDPNANALRWGTLYNFRFDANAPPGAGTVMLGLFRPGSPVALSLASVVPTPCPGAGVCGAARQPRRRLRSP